MTWRGDGLASLQDAADGSRVIHQGEIVDLTSISTLSDGWKVDIPSNSVFIQVEHGGQCELLGEERIAVVIDVEFIEGARASKIVSANSLNPKPVRIPPHKVMQLIEQTEKQARVPALATSTKNDDVVEEKSELAEQKYQPSSPVTSGQPEQDIIDPSAESVFTLSSERIGVFCGEDIILGTASLFEEHLESSASFVSINHPEWLFLDQISGDIMGTVPVSAANEPQIEFTIYAIGGKGGSAKATIEIECFEEQPAGPGIHDHELREDQPVNIDTKGMFAEFGLDISSLEFSVNGLPGGLSIDEHSGIVSGTIKTGSARNAPYEVVVTGTDRLAGGNGFGMRFLMSVIEEKKQKPGMDDQRMLAANDKLYRANVEC